MTQFYAPDIETTGLLPEDESLHCCRVLRKQAGDEIYVVDGKGGRYLCRITDPHPKHTAVEIIETEKETAPDSLLTLAVAPTKSSDRMEWLVEKAVELGVGRIVMLKCDRSERKNVKPERLKKVMVAAMKQSLRSRLPEVTDMIPFDKFMDETKDIEEKFFGYCSDEYPRREFVKEYKPGREVVVMIGPEGDFSPREVELAVKNGYVPVTFGPNRLRTETAALFAVAFVSAHC